MTESARVILWGSDIGAVSWLRDQEIGVFQYTPAFAKSNIEVAPFTMPLRAAPYQFPSLDKETFKGLPGLLADSLPDKFGNTLIDAWLSRQGRDSSSFTPVERLCYTGNRGMGALEFKPLLSEAPTSTRKVDIDALVSLANRVLDDRVALKGKFSSDDDQQVIEDILRVGTSAGGARAKAVLAWNEKTDEFRSGQAPSSPGFSQWLVKFDGIHGNRDKELADPQGFGRIEYAYYLMACAAGIDMEACRLMEEGGRAHFMTKRFDRTPTNKKLHMQSFGAMMHYNFNDAGAHSYEQALQTIKQLGLSSHDVEQQIRRAIFNVLARNQDDHVKNIAFLMDPKGQWTLSPAFDVTYSYNPTGDWTSQHQMSLNGKRNDFKTEDLITFAAIGGMKKTNANFVIAEVANAVANWKQYALDAQISKKDIDRIAKTHRLNLASTY